MLKRILAVAILLAAGLALAAPSAQAADIRGSYAGRTGCLVAGTCAAPTYGGPTTTHDGRAYPAWHRAILASHGLHVGWANAAHQRIAGRASR